MVRLSNRNDINGIIDLWKEAFGDSDKDIRLFLNAHYKPENTVVYDCDGVIASVLFLLDGDMHIKGIDYPSYYLYAACTLKEYRGRGIMAELLGYAKSIAAERDKFFIALKPAEESLYSFYSKFGYQAVFTKKIIRFNKNEQSKIYYKSIIDKDNNFSCIRDKMLSRTDYFKWDEDSVVFAFIHHGYYGGKCISNRKGYILYNVNDGVLRVKEYTFAPDIFRDFIADIATQHSVDFVIAELPYDFAVECCNEEIVKSGMLLPLNLNAEKLISDVENAYLALTLD